MKPEHLPNMIRRVRIMYFRYQDAFAAAIGRSKAEVALWESGQRRPSEESMDRIARALKKAGVTELEIEGLWAAWHRDHPADTWDVVISSVPGDLPLYRPLGKATKSVGMGAAK